MEVTTTMAALTSLASDVGTAATWFWGIFTDLVEMISTNNLLLWPVIFAIVAGTVGLAIKVVRKFGLKGRR